MAEDFASKMLRRCAVARCFENIFFRTYRRGATALAALDLGKDFFDPLLRGDLGRRSGSVDASQPPPCGSVVYANSFGEGAVADLSATVVVAQDCRDLQSRTAPAPGIGVPAPTLRPVALRRR